MAGAATSGPPRTLEQTLGVAVEARAVEATHGVMEEVRLVETRAMEATAGATVEVRAEATAGVMAKAKTMEEALPPGPVRAMAVAAGAAAEAKAEARAEVRVAGLETASMLTPLSEILALSVTSLSLQSAGISRRSSKAMATPQAASVTLAAHL